MKKIIPFIYLILAGGLFCISSCEMQKELTGKTEVPGSSGNTIHPDSIGILSLSLEHIQEGEIPSKSGDEVAEAANLNIYDFAVEILDEAGDVVEYFNTYKEVYEKGSILLPKGNYTIRAYYGDLLEAAFDMPYYEGTNTIEITPKDVATILTKCALANKKLTITKTEQFFEKFKEDYTIIMTNGTGVLTQKHNDNRTAYFKPSDRLEFIIHTTTVDGQQLTYSANLYDDDQVKESNNILIDLDIVPDTIPTVIPPGPDPGPGPGPEVPDTLYKPTLVVNISLIEVEHIIEIPSNFVNPDEGNSGGNEGGSGNDEDKPTITGTGLSSPIEVPISNAVRDVKVTIKTPLGLKSLVVEISAPTLMMELLSGMGLAQPFDMTNLTNQQRESLTDVGLAIPSDPYENLFDITDFVPLIGILKTPGDYKFKLTVTDQANNSVTETLTIRMTN